MHYYLNPLWKPWRIVLSRHHSPPLFLSLPSLSLLVHRSSWTLRSLDNEREPSKVRGRPQRFDQLYENAPPPSSSSSSPLFLPSRPRTTLLSFENEEEGGKGEEKAFDCPTEERQGEGGALEEGEGETRRKLWLEVWWWKVAGSDVSRGGEDSFRVW